MTDVDRGCRKGQAAPQSLRADGAWMDAWAFQRSEDRQPRRRGVWRDRLSADPAGERLRRGCPVQPGIICPLPMRSSGCGCAFGSRAARGSGFVDGADQPGFGRGRHAAAYLRYAEIEARPGRVFFDESDLLDLSLQLFTAMKIDLAIEVLGLNIHVYHEHVETYLERPKLYLHKGEFAAAKESLMKALSIEPDNLAAAELLERIQ